MIALDESGVWPYLLVNTFARGFRYFLIGTIDWRMKQSADTELAAWYTEVIVTLLGKPCSSSTENP